VKQLNAEIIDEVHEGEVENETDQADIFKEKIQRAIIDATSAITAKDAPVSEHSSVVMTITPLDQPQPPR